jgi:hypothetical protein
MNVNLKTAGIILCLMFLCPFSINAQTKNIHRMLRKKSGWLRIICQDGCKPGAMIPGLWQKR